MEDLNTKQRIIKFLSPILFPLFRFYWWLFRPTEYGVKVVVITNGQMLAIRNSYGWKRWTFPGGKIDKGESPIEAARRELMEETGIIPITLKQIGKFESRTEYKRDNIFVFLAEANDSNLKIDPFEIEEAQWFPVDKPPELGPVGRNIYGMYKDIEKSN